MQNLLGALDIDPKKNYIATPAMQARPSQFSVEPQTEIEEESAMSINSNRKVDSRHSLNRDDD